MERGDVLDDDDKFNAATHRLAGARADWMSLWKPGDLAEPEHSALAANRSIAAWAFADRLEAQDFTIEGD